MTSERIVATSERVAQPVELAAITARDRKKIGALIFILSLILSLLFNSKERKSASAKLRRLPHSFAID
jgi:hypothetical protein